MGTHIERTSLVDDGHAWVALSGRNLDGTEYRQAEYLAKKPDGWRIVAWPTAAAEKTRPPDFPLTFSDYEEDMTRLVAFEAQLFNMGLRPKPREHDLHAASPPVACSSSPPPSRAAPAAR